MTKAVRPVVLDADPSAAVRERLFAELARIPSADLAASWAREALTAKNNLTASDAKLVEEAFEQRLSQLGSSETATSSDDDAASPEAAVVSPDELAGTETAGTHRAKGIDKSVLAVAAPVGTATGSTFDISPTSPASSVAASPRTICASRNHGRE